MVGEHSDEPRTSCVAVVVGRAVRGSAAENGSATRIAHPRDIDVLAIYGDVGAVSALRAMNDWGDFEPPIDIIAMTAEEEAGNKFITGTNATLIFGEKRLRPVICR